MGLVVTLYNFVTLECDEIHQVVVAKSCCHRFLVYFGVRRHVPNRFQDGTTALEDGCSGSNGHWNHHSPVRLSILGLTGRTSHGLSHLT
jgi:hypothetical protein